MGFYLRIVEWKEKPNKDKIGWLFDWGMGLVSGASLITGIIGLRENVYMALFFIGVSIFGFTMSLFSNKTREVKYEKYEVKRK
ncbi:hypothetical protein LCGC14_1237100 [marine sediment metagenome]|uniref:Uncharacterized protein n=1 Tax=marine sediment metagenome TaxID=412755 RepID=A0A0F9PB31_9ZZZZ